MRKSLLSLLSITIFACAPLRLAVAQGWYAGAGLSSNNVFAVTSTGYFESSERGSGDTGFVINGGYRFSPNFGVEVGYAEGGTASFSTIATQTCGSPGLCRVDVQQKTTALEASLVGVLPFSRNTWEIHMKGGVAIWDATAVQQFTPIGGGTTTSKRISADGTDFMLGVGVGVMVGTRSRVRLEYQAFRTSDSLLGLDAGREARFDLFALEFHRLF